MHSFDGYANLYKQIRMKRENGILEVAIHMDGGPAIWTSGRDGVHAELGDAFYRIGRDRENKVVILTGTGDRFVTATGGASDEPMGTAMWDRIYKEGKDLLMNLLDIEVPVIGAVNGPAFIHAELLTMSDIVVASDRASFADKVHFQGGAVPGDGVHVWWLMLLGPNRGRHFLLSGEEISAAEAKALGFVAEVVPHDQCLARAWELARALIQKPTLQLRMTRLAFTQHIKRRMLDDLGYGLLAEGVAFLSLFEGRK